LRREYKQIQQMYQQYKSERQEGEQRMKIRLKEEQRAQ
jgi:hypothetical protein